MGLAARKELSEFGQKLGERIGVREQPDLSGDAIGISTEVFLQTLDLIQHGARVREQGAAGLGWNHALPAARQQRRAKRLFHVANAGRGGAEREMRPLGAVRDAAGFGDVAEQAKVDQVKPHRKLAFAN